MVYHYMVFSVVSSFAILDMKFVTFFFQVARLNPKSQSFTLKDDLYRHVQRDWPGYLEEEKQLIHRLLARLEKYLISPFDIFG